VLISDFPESDLKALIANLENQGFQPHLTSLGGSGVGVVTRPSATADEKVDSDEGNVSAAPLRATLRDTSADGLQAWSEKLGHWKYT
jgi:hypothetical protein